MFLFTGCSQAVDGNEILSGSAGGWLSLSSSEREGEEVNQYESRARPAASPGSHAVPALQELHLISLTVITDQSANFILLSIIVEGLIKISDGSGRLGWDTCDTSVLVFTLRPLLADLASPLWA